jgi:hypothetical protein
MRVPLGKAAQAMRCVWVGMLGIGWGLSMLQFARLESIRQQNQSLCVLVIQSLGHDDPPVQWAGLTALDSLLERGLSSFLDLVPEVSYEELLAFLRPKEPDDDLLDS